MEPRHTAEPTTQRRSGRNGAWPLAALPAAALATGCQAGSVGTTTAVLSTAAAAAAVAAAWGLVTALRRTMVRPLVRDRDRISGELQRVTGERAALLGEREQLLQDREARLAQLQNLTGQLQSLTAERAALTAALDELTAERDELQGSVDATFVNLAMRTLTLVERQLVLIETLEGAETEPTQLENLYRLDHLATRMRRNSENMLLLAGLENSRRGSRNVPLLDVLRAAVSEIERYERVRITFLPRVRLAGAAADDTSHLVAELLENATAYSPPQDMVEVGGWLLDNGALMISVVDHGIGIPAERMRELNEKLDNPDAGEAEPLSGKAPWREQTASARSMGLFVVSRLARRHGVRVQLRETTVGGGTTVIVVVPREAVVDAEVTAAEVDEQREAERSARVAAAAQPTPGVPPLPVRGEPGAPLPVRTNPGAPLPQRIPPAPAARHAVDDSQHGRSPEAPPAGSADPSRPRHGAPTAGATPPEPGGEAPAGPVTRLGLPRRVPRGSGLPGTGEAPVSGLRREAGPGAGTGEHTGSTPAAELRRRLGGFQSGLRQAAREAAADGSDPAAVPSATSSGPAGDEEATGRQGRSGEAERTQRGVGGSSSEEAGT